MFRFDGEVFLLGTAIAAPSHASRTTIKIATICASSQRASQMVSTAGGGRIVANRGSYSGTSRSCKGRVRSGLEGRNMGAHSGYAWLCGRLHVAERPARHAHQGLAEGVQGQHRATAGTSLFSR